MDEGTPQQAAADIDITDIDDEDNKENIKSPATLRHSGLTESESGTNRRVSTGSMWCSQLSRAGCSLHS